MEPRRAAFFAAGLAITAALAGETADELIAKNVQARGGLEKIRAVKSMRMTGSMRLGQENLPTVLELKRPGKTRWEFTLEGQTAVQAYDGKTAWMTMPFAGVVEPQLMSAAETADIELQADMDGPLIDAKAKGNEITVVGRGMSDDGTDSWHLKLKRKGGDVRDIYLDAKTYLQILTVTRRDVDGKDVEIKSRIGDYRNVQGLMLPHSFEAVATGVPETQSLKFDKIDLDVPIDDSRFTMPKSSKSGPPALGGGGR